MWDKYIITIVVLANLFANLALAGPVPETLVIGKGSQNYPPYHWTEGDKVIGLVPDIIRNVAKRLGVQSVKFEAYPWKRMLKQAKLGHLDAVMPLYSTKERREYLDFPKEPLIYEKVAFFTLKTNEITYSGNLKNLLPFRIGTIAGYSYGPEFDSLNFKRIKTRDETSLFNMLKEERYKVGISDIRVLAYYANTLSFNPSILEPNVSKEPLYIGFSKQKQFGEFVTKFSDALVKFKTTTAYRDILLRYGLEN